VATWGDSKSLRQRTKWGPLFLRIRTGNDLTATKARPSPWPSLKGEPHSRKGSLTLPPHPMGEVESCKVSHPRRIAKNVVRCPETKWQTDWQRKWQRSGKRPWKRLGTYAPDCAISMGKGDVRQTPTEGSGSH
jgi:hypothetical protein